MRAKLVVFFALLVLCSRGEGKDPCAVVASETARDEQKTTSLRHDLGLGFFLMAIGYPASAIARDAYDLHSHPFFATYSNTFGSFVFTQPLLHFLEKTPLKSLAAPIAFGLGVAGNLAVENIWRGASLDIPDVLGGTLGTAVGLAYYRWRQSRIPNP